MFEQIENLNDLLEVKLQGLYDAEKQLVQALPKLIDCATSPQLGQDLEKHLRETKAHVARLEQVARNLRMDLNGPGCQVMASLVDEASQLLAMRAADDVRDAALLAAAQGIEHYKIAQYGTVVQFANRVGHRAEADLLSQLLAEEKNANETLTQLATSSVSEAAMS